MKVSIGMNLQSGPWGGGNQFGRALVDYLQYKKVEVSFDLSSPNLDLILLAEPRKNLTISAFTDREIFQYITQMNPQAIVVHRVNECDERKGTKGVNRRLMRASLCSDHTVFVSTWLKELLFNQGMAPKSFNIILNGTDRKIFHAQGYQRWNRTNTLKLVTHHWGASWLKGFDIYEHVDGLLGSGQYKEMLEFTYIGQLPEGFKFHNATYVEPKYGPELAALIREHHVYLTAACNEPGSNHQNEGANCGLPLLYRDSGSLPEYCAGFGISFARENFEDKLLEIMDKYDSFVDQMKDYPHTTERMCSQYYDLFVDLIDRREEILKQRKWWRRPLWMLKCVSPRTT